MLFTYQQKVLWLHILFNSSFILRFSITGERKAERKVLYPRMINERRNSVDVAKKQEQIPAAILHFCKWVQRSTVQLKK